MRRLILPAVLLALGYSPGVQAYTSTATVTFSWGTDGRSIGWTSNGANAIGTLTDSTYFSSLGGNNSNNYFNGDFASSSDYNPGTGDDCLTVEPGYDTIQLRRYGCRVLDSTGYNSPLFKANPPADLGPGAAATGLVTVTDTTLTGTLQVVSTTDESGGATGYNYRSADGSPFGNVWYGVSSGATLTVNLTGVFTATSWLITGGTVRLQDPGFQCQQSGFGGSAPGFILCNPTAIAGGFSPDGSHLSWGADVDGGGGGTEVAEIEVRDVSGASVIERLSGVLASVQVAGDGSISTVSGEYRSGLAIAGRCAYGLQWDGTRITCGTLITGLLAITGSLTAPEGPAAGDDVATTNRNTPVDIPVLANDTNFGQPLNASVLDAPANGTAEVVGTPDGEFGVTIRYTPDPGFDGEDSFTYSATDGVDTDTAVVTVTVVPPVARDDAAQSKPNGSVSFNPLNNDTGFGETVTVQVLSAPAHGTASVTGSPGGATGVRINYVPVAGFIGPDSLVYEVSDGINTASATVSLTVLSYRTVEDQYSVTTYNYTTLDVTANDIGFQDPVNLYITRYPNCGSAYVQGSPGPKAGITIEYYAYCGNGYQDSFEYQIYDGTNFDRATVTVTAVSYLAVDDKANAAPGIPVVIPVAANDLGFGYPRTIGIYSNPLHGTVTVNPAQDYYGNPTVTYVANTGYTGPDSFEYAIEDGARIDVAVVAIKVIADKDGDLIGDDVDNCVNDANPSQRDSDGDGYGNWCDADLDNSGFVNFADLAAFRQRFATPDPHADFDGSGNVNFADLGRFRQLFGRAPGPSGAAP